MDQENLLLSGIAVTLSHAMLKQKKQRRRKYIRGMYERRVHYGAFYTLGPQLDVDPEKHMEYYRMSKRRFEDLLSRIGHRLEHAKTHRYPIGSRQRLSLTLRYLASGDDQRSIAFLYWISPSAVSKIIRETCDLLWKELHQEFMPVPDRQKWKEIANDFWQLWQFPMCVGAIDGKHVTLKKPKNSGSDFYNYKGTFSINLMAAADAHYRYIFIDVGAFGRQSDSGVFAESELGKRLQNPNVAIADNGLALPFNCFLPGTKTSVPHVFVADDAFPLKRNLIKPYNRQSLDLDQLIFNYRLSRTRRVSENMFGITIQRWRILSTKFSATVETAESVVRACVILHNYLKSTDATYHRHQQYMPQGSVDYENEHDDIVAGAWRNETSTLNEGKRRRGPSTPDGYAVRDTFKQFFMTDGGSLPWQERVVTRT